MKGDNIAQRLSAFGADTIRMVRTLPEDRAGRHIADQLLRSATAGGSNYEEARSAQSRRDFVHKVSLASKELREALYWLSIVEKTEPDLAEVAKPMREEGLHLVAILTKSATTAKNTTGHQAQGIRAREAGIGSGNTHRAPGILDSP
jgi:four helix bundle protein